MKDFSSVLFIHLFQEKSLIIHETFFIPSQYLANLTSTIKFVIGSRRKNTHKKLLNKPRRSFPRDDVHTGMSF